MDEILKLVSASQEDFNRIKSASRARRLTATKIRYIEECLKRNYRMEDIGKNIGISQVAVSRMLNRGGNHGYYSNESFNQGC